MSEEWSFSLFIPITSSFGFDYSNNGYYIKFCKKIIVRTTLLFFQLIGSDSE